MSISVIEEVKRRQLGGSRSVKFKIDKFDELEGAILVRAVTLPVTEGEYGQAVEERWIDTDTFSLTLDAGKDFPISIRGMRTPMNISKIVAKETKAIVDPRNPRTWTLEMLRRGSVECMKKGYCIHERVTDGAYKCPKAVDLPAGRVEDGDSLWVMRVDGPPCREEDLESRRKAEKAADKATNERIAANLAYRRDKPAQPIREVQHTPTAPPLVMGGSGPPDQVQ